jgi:Arc/MetJ-type ribon-helix-helix transcriptional regulator
MIVERQALMNISVDKPELEKFIDEKIRSGQFSSPAEVIEAGLARLMLDPISDDLDEQDLNAIEESEQQIDRGEDRDWRDVSAQLRKKYLGQ